VESMADSFNPGSIPGPKLRIAVVGAGSRGASFAKAFHASQEWELAAMCDVDFRRVGKLSGQLGGVPCFETIDELLDTVELDAVAIATPLRTLHGTAMTALRTGRHVLVERPLADNLERGREMAAEADAGGLVLMGNTALSLEPAVQKMARVVGSGSLGEILFVEALRTEDSAWQSDRDVFWDLAPDTLTVLDHVLPEGLKVQDVSAFGGDPLGTGHDCVGHVNFRLPNDAPLHLQVNNLSHVKGHQLVIAGTRMTLVWDAMFPQEHLRLYDSASFTQPQHLAQYWTEPALLQPPNDDEDSAPEQEALPRHATEFAQSIRGKRKAKAAYAPALRVLSILEAVTHSRSLDGQTTAIATVWPDGAVQEHPRSWFKSALWAR
jgi:predicted dehydrogenase